MYVIGFYVMFTTDIEGWLDDEQGGEAWVFKGIAALGIFSRILVRVCFQGIELVGYVQGNVLALG